MTKDKVKKKALKKSSATTPVLGSPNHVFQENKGNGTGGGHGLRNTKNSNNNSTVNGDSETGKLLNVSEISNKSDFSDSNDSLYEDKPCACAKSDIDSWKLVCSKCKQTWHSSCANLKGAPEKLITSLELWLCPWCFVTPVPKPQSYFSESVIEADGTAIYNFSKEFQNLSNSVTKTVNKKFEELTKKLEKLEPQLKSDTMTELNNDHDLDFNNSGKLAQPSSCDAHGECYINEISEQFLDENSCNELKTFFETCEFTPEKGHSVISFGESYRYNGSKSEPNEIPPILTSVIDKINGKFELEGNLKINSCLVNKFSGPETLINEHSDDERNIHPESSIFTISLGDARTITFRELSSSKTFEHTPKNGSIYSMTLKSQYYFKHQIFRDEQFSGTRYSLTFRVVSWRNWNSTCIVGDSNTGHLAFGTEAGTFGPATPGKKFFAPTIDKINPHDCIGYSNVVVMCGINNIKVTTVRNQTDIRTIYNVFKSKIESISKLNRKAKIFICPILPTKSHELNKKALFFNRLIFNDLVMCNYGVSTVHGFDEFVDSADGLLSRNLSRPHMNDILHLNSKGTKTLAEKIKTSIFQRKKSGSRAISGRTYSSMLQQGLRPS